MIFLEPDIDYAIELISPLLEEHSKEAGFNYAHGFNITPNYDLYREAFRLGGLYILVAMEDKEVKGYLVTFIIDHHQNKLKLATSDLLYVHPSKRGSTLWKELIGRAEQSLRLKGVNVLSLTVKPEHGVLLKRIAYNPMEVTYSKNLGE